MENNMLNLRCIRSQELVPKSNPKWFERQLLDCELNISLFFIFVCMYLIVFIKCNHYCQNHTMDWITTSGFIAKNGLSLVIQLFFNILTIFQRFCFIKLNFLTIFDCFLLFCKNVKRNKKFGCVNFYLYFYGNYNRNWFIQFPFC